MIANNNSPYSGYKEVNRVKQNADESEKNRKLVSARTVVLILYGITL